MNPTRFQQEMAAKLEPLILYHHIESNEAAHWLNAANSVSDPVFTLSAGLLCLPRVRRDQLNRLLVAVLGDITYDQLGELRDALRSLLCDEVLVQIRDCITEQEAA